MDIGIVSMRYAKALIEYAKGTGTEDRVYRELRMLERSFRKHPDLREALDNPISQYKGDKAGEFPAHFSITYGSGTNQS